MLDDICESAAYSGDANMMLWLASVKSMPEFKNKSFVCENNNFPWSKFPSGSVILDGNLDMLKLAVINNYRELDDELGLDAVIYGQMDILIWYKNSGGYITSSFFRLAVEHGHFDVLKYLVEHENLFEHVSRIHQVYNSEYDDVFLSDLHIMELLINAQNKRIVDNIHRISM